MPYVAGTANSLADLLTAVQAACAANGWTKSSSGAVLYKGTCYAELINNGTVLTLRGGTGIDGSGNLTGPCDTGMGQLAFSGFVYPAANTAFAWPCGYEVFVNTAPDEVYVVVNFAGTFYESLGFGQSAMPGLTGTGNWYSAGMGGRGDYYTTNGEGAQSGWAGSHSLFCAASNHQNSGVHHALDSATWAIEGAWRDWADPFFRQPNQWDQESILIPIRVYASRPSGFISPVLECAYARYINVANLQDQQIITLGPDRWKVYPWWSRGAAYTYTGANGTQTGVAGHAFHYDGP